jgi:hypothetical protein
MLSFAQDTKTRAEKLRAELEAQLTAEQMKSARSRAHSIVLETVAQELMGL